MSHKQLLSKAKQLATLYDISNNQIMADVYIFKVITSTKAASLKVLQMLTESDFNMTMAINKYYNLQNKKKNTNSNKNKKRGYESDSDSDLEIIKPPQKKQKHNSDKEEA
eukprot:534201_1